MEAATTNIDELKGEALDAALESVGLLEGNRSRPVEEKRDLLRDYEQQVASDGTALVAVAYPVDRFDSNVDGVPVLTSEPQLVSKDKLAALRAAADSADVKLTGARA